MRSVAFVIAFTCVGCGTVAVATTPDRSAVAPPIASAPTASAKPAAPPPSDITAEQHAALDVTEHGQAVAMPPLFEKTAPKSSYPKVTTGDRACWQGIVLTGDHDRDYDAIVARCGAATGLREYTKPVRGRLHHLHDKRDTYRIKLAGGLCYRYFAVADAKVSDLDILVETTGGALVADDRTKQPVAIIEQDKPWCLDDDKEYDFHIEVDGVGDGFYRFGVWARPHGVTGP